MFDNLKKSLGKFRSDVEESAEVDEDSTADEDDVGEGDAAAEANPASTDGTAGQDVEETPEQPASDDAEAGEEVQADAALAEAEQAEAAPSEAEQEEPPEGADDDESNGPGMFGRAKAAARGRVYIDEDDLEGPLWELEMALLENDVAMDVAEDLTDHLQEDLVGEQKGITTRTGSVVQDALYDALLDVLSVGQFDFDQRIAEADKPVVLIFTGVNGVGKTTSIAKLSQYLEDRGYSSVLANGDTFRAGANEQIQKHADNLDKKLIHHDRGGDPAAVIYDAVEYAEAHDIDVVLGDTAGRLHTNEGLMDQLEKIGRVVGPDLTIFVDESVAGQDATQRAKQFDEAATIDGAILTKADADSSGGAAISVAHVTGKPILFLGTGQGYDDLERFEPEAMVERLLED